MWSEISITMERGFQLAHAFEVHMLETPPPKKKQEERGKKEIEWRGTHSQYL